jgi:disulfide bond formation protein DsbB
MTQFLKSRWADVCGFFFSFSLVILALYIQTANQLEPCPLCISQRIIFMALGLAFLLSAFLRQRILQFVLAGAQILIALGGVGVALRHWWIQAHKGQMWVDCGVGFDYMFDNFPLKKMLTLIFRGTGDCANIDWTLLGLTLPQLALIAYLGLALYAGLMIKARRHVI